MKYCFLCDNRFDRHQETGPCPILDCGGDVVEIDDNIFHTIKTLNYKGYTTKYCGSGHIWEGSTSTYIIFDPMVHNECFFNYPNGIDEAYPNCPLLVMTKLIDAADVFEKQKALNETAYDLNEWAEELPVANRLIVGFYDKNLFLCRSAF